MRERKHTPAPWTSGGHEVSARVGFAQCVICKLSTSAPSGGGAYKIDEHRDELTANAALIAAAPDLLEELIDAAVESKCGCGHPACKQCERDARYAETIDKALGHNAEAQPPR